MKLKTIVSGMLFSYSMIIGTGLSAASCPVDLIYKPIQDDFYDTEAEAINHQYGWQIFLGEFSSAYQFEVHNDFTIPLKPVFKESKADKRTKVFGYHEDGKLDLDGGKKKSYNKSFKNFKVRQHLALETKLPGYVVDPLLGPEIVTTPLYALDACAVENVYRHNVPYFYERGFEIQGPDTFKEFDNQFIWTSGAGHRALGFFAMRLIYDEKNSDHKKMPCFIDLHAIFPERFIMDTYQGDHFDPKNTHGYPTRLPLTTDFCRYQKDLNSKPIAFYDTAMNVLTVHVPATGASKYFTGYAKADLQNPLFDIDREVYLTGCDASFKTFKQKSNGQLVVSSLQNADVFAQVSEFATFSSRITDNLTSPPTIEFADQAIAIQEEVFEQGDLSYTGIVLNKMNGGSKAYDNYTIPYPNINAYVAGTDPRRIPDEKANGKHFKAGDNPNTRIHEKYGLPNVTNFFDTEGWDYPVLKLPIDVITGKVSYPENGLVKNNSVTNCLISGFDDTRHPTQSAWIDNVALLNGKKPSHHKNFHIKWPDNAPQVDKGTLGKYPKKPNKNFNTSLIKAK